MKVKINSENIKKLKGKWKRATSLVLSGVLVTTLLTNYQTISQQGYGYIIEEERTNCFVNGF